jgi:DNA processing protein
MFEKQKYWVWLSETDISPRKKQKLVEWYGDPVNVWHASERELKSLGFLSEENVMLLRDKIKRSMISQQLEKIQQEEIRIVIFTDTSYPEYLKNIHDPPIVLYVKGKIGSEEKAIAVVGSRKASTYGMHMAEEIAYELCQRGLTVVSGMARGVDSWAHRGSLKAKGRTIAVLGSGLDTVYPPENAGLMQEIAETGAVVSEYVPGVPPVPQNFPARNRIISGLSMGVVVIEATDKSGSLITANFALDQGREVFALPGNINSSNSRGTNKLIKEGAKVVTCITDILEELSVFLGDVQNAYKPALWKTLFNRLEEEERNIAEVLQEETLHIDILAIKTGYTIQMLNSRLVLMEMNGIVEQLPGKIFRLVL